MFYELTEKQQSWADSVFSSLTMEEKAAQLLHPVNRSYSLTELEDMLQKIPCGSCFTFEQDFQCMKERHKLMQKWSKVPLLISADMECGTNFIKDKTLLFPYQMGLTAARDPENAYKMGKLTAKLSRAAGVHWTFSPVVDLNLNPLNPIVNNRSLGSKKSDVIRFAGELLRGLQEDEFMAATCKHFPGDGVDDRDQHQLVSVNSLPVEQWERLYGEVWKSVISAGTKTIMSGHISFPDYQDMADDPDNALPATLCGKLQNELLRGKFKFNKVIVSDAFPMVGFTCRYPEEELAWRNIASGSDSVLFSNPERDFKSLMDALKKGFLTEEQIETSARRIIELKASLNLFEDCFGPDMDEDEFNDGKAFAQSVSDSAVTILRSSEDTGRPLVPGRDKKILTVTMARTDTSEIFRELPVIDEELKKRGFETEHLFNPNSAQLKTAMDNYDRIFINFNISSHCSLALPLVGRPAMSFWRCFFTRDPSKVTFTSFGSPYTLYHHPYLPNCSCVWGPFDVCQKSAVKFWCGELAAKGTLPVKTDLVKVKALDLPDDYY